MRETITKTIGDVEYSVTQLPDPDGSQLFMRLVRILTPILGSGLKGLPVSLDDFSISNITTQALGEGLISFAANMTEEDFLYVYDTLIKDARFNNGSGWVPLTSDKSHWSGRFSKKLLWIVFALEVNYADFLGGRESLARLVEMLRVARPSKYPNTSTGESNESSQVNATP
jgi:hypothetical protein